MISNFPAPAMTALSTADTLSETAIAPRGVSILIPSHHDDPQAGATQARGESSNLTGADALTVPENFPLSSAGFSPSSNRPCAPAAPDRLKPELHAPSTADWDEAEALAQICRDYQKLRPTYSLRQAARALDKSVSYFSGADSVLARYERGGVAALLPARRESGAKPILFTDLPEWFIPAASFHYLLTNRTWRSGSVPEALRRTISLPHMPTGWDQRTKLRLLAHLGLNQAPTCPAELRDAILQREREGKPMLTSQLMRQIAAPELTIRSVRSPRNAWLDYVQSPGSLMLTVDQLTGLERYVEPGEWFTIDDGTLNFACCVPLEKPGDPCWDKFGVLVGRFQFLLIVDHRSYFIPGFSHTARPRSSYRAEDLTATMHNTFVEHGAPKVMVMENGISAANLVKSTLGALGVKIQRAASPHQKVVEGVYNKLWTKLSGVRGQVGRYQGEEEAANKLLVSCRAGATDPRRHFPSLAEVLQALREAIAEHNGRVVNGRYGRFVPQEFFARQAPRNLRPLSPDSAWMFSPVISNPLKVDGYLVKTAVPILPGLSQKFAFEADFLGEYHGAQVKLFFNPLAPNCVAKVVLAHDFRLGRAGQVLGDAIQFDRQARYTRRILEYGFDPDIGLASVQKHAHALRRSAQAIRPGREGASTVEVRNGLGDSARLEISGDPTAAPASTSQECAGRLSSTQSLTESAPHSAGRNPGGGNLSPNTSAPSDPSATSDQSARAAEAARYETENALDFL